MVEQKLSFRASLWKELDTAENSIHRNADWSMEDDGEESELKDNLVGALKLLKQACLNT